ncbi:MAG: hypothetical protein JNN05_04195 [Candidatus Omnitrophica bacterium]|nr:hypothetical protein [Candidatus Omnitrophota bacterium]
MKSFQCARAQIRKILIIAVGILWMPVAYAADISNSGIRSSWDSKSSVNAIDEESEAMKDVEREIQIKAAQEKRGTSSALPDNHMNNTVLGEAAIEVTNENWMPTPDSSRSNAPVDKLSRTLKIDQTIQKAQSIKMPAYTEQDTNATVISGFNDQTATQMIDSLIQPDFLKTKVDLDFGDASLGDVFMTLGKAGHINIMLDPAVKDLMTEIYLQQVTVKEALILMANAHNLGFKKVEGSLYVAPIEKLQNQAVGFKIIRLRNIKALEAKTFVTDLARVVNISEQTNSLIVIGNPDEIQKVQKAVESIDYPQPQVVLEANIVEVNKDALKDLGVDWSDEVVFSYQESGRPFELPNVTDPSKSVLTIGALERTPLSFTTAIKMLESQNKAKVLSNPRVTTMNEREAEIFVGDRIPYTVNTVSGGATTTEVRFEEPGIRLKITPSIIDGDYVVIKVEPEVSFIFTFRGPQNEFPWVKKRQATAYVRVRNNQPFALGGLLNQEDRKNLFKVPMLGNIPLIGNLFTYEKHSVLDTELIITITPTVVQAKP